MASPWIPEEATLLRRRAVRTKLRKFLHQESLSIEALAKSTGLDPAWLQDLTCPNSRSPLTDPRFESLAKALEISPLELLRYEVFVVWDTQIEAVEPTLDHFARNSDDQVRIRFAKANSGSREIWRNETEPCLRDADRVIALVDMNNANVGYEIGYALGLGVQVVLATARKQRASFVDKPPLNNWVVKPLPSDCPEMGLSELKRLILDEEEDPALPTPLTPGDRTFVLCAGRGVGETYLTEIRSLRPDWIALPPQGWNLNDFQSSFRGAGRIVWLILEAAKDDRDGPDNASHAATAGYLHAHGLSTIILRKSGARLPVDVAVPAHTWTDSPSLHQKIEAIPAVVPGSSQNSKPEPSPTPIELLAQWRRSLVLELQQVVTRGSAMSVDMRQVVPRRLEPHLDSDAPPGRAHATLRHSGADLDGEAQAPGDAHFDLQARLCTTAPQLKDRRLVLIGDPGAGKSTLLRHLAWSMAQLPDAPLPILWHVCKLAELNDKAGGRDIFDLAGEEFDSAREDRRVAFVNAMRARSRQPGGVCLLLDGWDELGGLKTKVLTRLNRFLDQPESSEIRVVVCTRGSGFDQKEFSDRFQGAVLRPLDPDKQRTFLVKRLGEEDGADAYKRLQGSPALSGILGSPLILSLVADLVRAGREIPRRRRELYSAAIDCLLERRQSAEESAEARAPGVRNVEAVKLLLPALAYHLLLRQCSSKETPLWKRTDFFRALQDSLTDKTRALLDTWDKDGTLFLNEVSERSGLFGPLLRSDQPWTFLHRTFQEFLASEFLNPTTEASLAWEPALAEISKLPGFLSFAEVFAFLAGAIPEAQVSPLLLKLQGTKPELFWRALPEVETLSISQGLDLLFSAKDRDGDRLSAGLKGWGSDLSYETIETEVHGWVKRRPHPAGSLLLTDHACLLYALESLQLHCHRRANKSPTLTDQNALAERFFAVVGGQFSSERPTISRVRIPPGDADSCSFRRHPSNPGSDGHTPDTTLTRFDLGETAVTFEEFRALDPARSQSMNPRLPATGVNWWEAWLFARWIGGDLPTEAQWEVACRAGTNTNWWCGNTETEIQRYEWYRRNLQRRPWPVAECRGDRHPWKLQDMTGLVWQWCKDWRGDYPSGTQLNPGGPSRGSDRVLRGGSFGDVASRAQSAYRDWFGPSRHDTTIGFRVCFPRALSSTFDP